jgi:hypothetical protein
LQIASLPIAQVFIDLLKSKYYDKNGMDHMSTGLEKGVGFSPIIDPVIKKFGPIGAVVYGVAYRFSNMRNGACYASQSKIADMACVSRDTANHWLKELVQGDYLRLGKNEITKNTNMYFPTGKAGIKILAYDQKDKTEYENTDHEIDLNYGDLV